MSMQSWGETRNPKLRRLGIAAAVLASGAFGAGACDPGHRNSVPLESGGTDQGGTGASGVVSGGVTGAGSWLNIGGSGATGGRNLGGEAGAPPINPSAGMLGAPLVIAPTSQSFGINVVFVGDDPRLLRARVRPSGSTEAWRNLDEPTLRGNDVAEWFVSDLEAGSRYDYEIFGGAIGPVLYAGSAATQAKLGQAFRFDLLTDSHIFPRRLYPLQSAPLEDQEATLVPIAANMVNDHPDFMVNLGDMLDFHIFGFNDPPPTSADTRDAYLNYRRVLGDALGNMAHFPVVGNWDGENGDFTAEEIERSRSQRLLYAPGPTPDTYPEGGHDAQDYYAFQWGDALFVVLNVMTYTPTAHLLSHDPVGVPDDWTLGSEQLTFLEETLQNATSTWRFLLIHHVVGGKAGTDADSAYGRGGGQAARVGEQSKVHDLMLQHGVQVFFYGHDHVFADMIVDNIHYTLPGSAGAPWKFDSLYTGYETYWTDSGHARVDVSPETLGVEFVNVEGKVIYSYKLDAPK
jgi:hypothetical protein